MKLKPSLSLAQLQRHLTPSVAEAVKATEAAKSTLVKNGYAIVAIHDGTDGAPAALLRRIAGLGVDFFTASPDGLKRSMHQKPDAGDIDAEGRRLPKHGYFSKQRDDVVFKEVLNVCWEGGKGGAQGRATVGGGGFGDEAMASLDRSFMLLEGAAERAVEAAAEAIGVPSRDVKSLLDTSKHLLPGQASSSHLSLIRYNAIPMNNVLAEPHIDGGLLTAIYCEKEGLQIRLANGRWADMPASQLILLVGAQLERLTGGALRAVEHRVVAKDNRTHHPRVSLVFKLRARPDAVLDPHQFADTSVGPEPITVADFEKQFAAHYPSINYTRGDGNQQEEQEEEEGQATIASAGSFQVTVRTLTTERFMVNVWPDTTFGILKELVWKHEGIPPDQQRLVFAGRQGDNDSTITSYNMGPGATVHVVLGLKGD